MQETDGFMKKYNMTGGGVSILIPTYNRAKYLRLTIDNFVKQIVENDFQKCVEIVVSDNASDDGTVSLLVEYQQRYSAFFRFNSNEENIGFGKNIRKLVGLAHYEYVWLCGDDDIYNKNIISVLVQVLKDNTFDYLQLNYSDVDKIESSVEYKKEFLDVFETKTELLLNIKNAPGFVSGCVFRKKIFIDIYTENDNWVHFVKILNMSETGRFGFYRENCIFVFRPKENNWFAIQKMLPIIMEIIFEISISNCTNETKSMLLGLYKQNLKEVYIKRFMTSLDIDTMEKIKIQKMCYDVLHRAFISYCFDWKSELKLLSNFKFCRIAVFVKNITRLLFFYITPYRAKGRAERLLRLYMRFV